MDLTVLSNIGCNKTEYWLQQNPLYRMSMASARILKSKQNEKQVEGHTLKYFNFYKRKQHTKSSQRMWHKFKPLLKCLIKTSSVAEQPGPVVQQREAIWDRGGRDQEEVLLQIRWITSNKTLKHKHLESNSRPGSWVRPWWSALPQHIHKSCLSQLGYTIGSSIALLGCPGTPTSLSLTHISKRTLCTALHRSHLLEQSLWTFGPSNILVIYLNLLYSHVQCLQLVPTNVLCKSPDTHIHT